MRIGALRPWRLAGVLAIASLGAAACGAGAGGASGGGGSSSSKTVTVAVVANPDMQQMEQLVGTFQKQNPGITVKFDTLPENQERADIQKDIATNGGEYDVVMISNYETPIWARNGWLDNLTSQFVAKDPSYDAGDLLPPVASSLSYNGGLYSVPFYGESSMLYYRKSMLKAAGITMPLHPTWAQVAAAAAKLNKPGQVAGICLRGEEGWGENLATLDTVINTFGGSWYNSAWKPELTSPATEKAVNFYVNLVRKDGEPGAASDGFTELLTLYQQSKCAMWYDSTVAASSLSSAKAVFNDTGYAFAPVDKTPASGWLYTWSLGIPKDSANQAAAWKFVSWATSKPYLQLVGKKYGWAAVPPGSRTSTYQTPQYESAAKAFASITLKSIDSVNQADATVPKVPYVGIQFVDIPQFENLGTEVSEQIAAAITGSESVAKALSISQQDAAPVGAQQH
jgi:sorbitol/mannitol transport system substrate-binding protein